MSKIKYEKGQFYEAMLCEEGSKADLENSEYGCEPKFDGRMAIAERTDVNGLRIHSKRGCNYTEILPDIIKPLSKIRAFFRIIGELVYIDANGHMIFAGSQKRCQISKAEKVEKYMKAYPLVLHIFDITMLNGENLEDLPYVKRRQILVHFIELQKILYGLDNIRVVPMTLKNTEMYEWCIKNGFEGVVLKQLFAKYERGKRSKAYLKVKIREHTIWTLDNEGKLE